MTSDGPENGGTRSDLSGDARDVVQARDISGGIHFHGPAPDAVLIPAQLPADVRGFVNRAADFRQLDIVFGQDFGHPGSASVCVIAGTAGVGKTSLAVRWGHHNRERFPDGQLYINLRGYDPGEPATAANALERFLIALGVPIAGVPAELDDRSALFRSLLAARRVLIVLDNAATVSQVRPLLPGAGLCLALVTSRSRLSGLVTRDGAHRVTLEVLGEREAVELLKITVADYRSGDDDTDIVELARLCARLPLALRIAAERAAARPRMPMVDLIENLRDESQLWDALSAEDDDEADAVRAVFAWSYRALPEDVARTFRLLGLHPGPDFSSEAAAALTAAPLDAARRRLDALVGAYLVEQVGPDRFQFHDLLRTYALGQARALDTYEVQDEALRRCLEWYLHSANNCVSALSGNDPAVKRLTFPLPGENVRPQHFSGGSEAAAWFEQERANLTAGVQAAARQRQWQLAWQIPASLCLAYTQHECFDDWFTSSSIGLKAARLSGDSTGEVYLLESLTMASRQSHRQREALEFAAGALEIHRRNGDSYGEATILTVSALVHTDAHRLSQARALLAEAEALCHEHDYRSLLFSIRSNLGNLENEAGRFEDAYTLARQVHDLAVDSGNLRNETIGTWLLACACLGLGRLDEASTWAGRSLTLVRDAGQTTLEAFYTLHFGAIERRSGRSADALIMYQRSAGIHRRVGNRGREAQALDGSGEVYRDLGRWEEAAQFHRRAAAVFRELGDTWRVAVTLDHLALAMRGLGDVGAAARTWREALPLLADFDDPAAGVLRTSIETALAAAL